jgi:uncharacterized protein YbaP (TraB family)
VTRALAALLSLLAALGGMPAEARERSILWAVEGQQNTVYLLGSIHVLRPGDGGLPEAAQRAYEDAEQLVMEIDLDDPAQADPVAMAGKMQAAALLPEGQTLRGILGADYETIRTRVEPLGLDLASLDRYAPWFVATLVLQLELARRGFMPELGIEQQLAGRAVEDGKPIHGLETAEDQFAILAALSLPEQKRFLLMTLQESAQLEQEVDRLIAAWRSGDGTLLDQLLSEEFAAFPELYGPLTQARNRAWVEQLAGLLDDRDDYLVVVGALHLVGRESVVELLRRRGFPVTQQ